MSALEADVVFDFTFPSACTPPPPSYGLALDGALRHIPAFLQVPHGGHHSRRHARFPSRASSIYSPVSTVDSTPDSVCARLTTPPRASPPVVRRHHGPLLLPRIRPQDQNLDGLQPPIIGAGACRANKARATMPSPRARLPSAASARATHARSYTSPETLDSTAGAPLSAPVSHHAARHGHMTRASPVPPLCPATSSMDDALSTEPDIMPSGLPSESPLARRASAHENADTATITDEYGGPPYRRIPLSLPSTVAGTAAAARQDFGLSSYVPRTPSPLGLPVSPSQTPPPPAPSTTLLSFLTAPNPVASLVHNISFPLRDPSIKYFWWDVRNIRSWNSFNACAVLSLPGAQAMLTTTVPAPVLPRLIMSARHPETEAALHGIYASFYLPKLNSALAISSNRPLQLSVPTKSANGINDLIFVANPAGESATAATMFGGKPSARVVGLVRSFDRFNTGMRVEGNIKRVEYLRSLSALHYAMREHGCRYGFIMTEIELVMVRAGVEPTPFFGYLEIASVQLAVSAPQGGVSGAAAAGGPQTPLTACLSLWALCQMAGDDSPAAHAHWRADIGAPAEGTRRKAKPRDNWMSQPQLAEKRDAKRSRGWVWPEDAIGRKEMGKRGVRYSHA